MSEPTFALDSRAVLGLLAKANQMFTSVDTFLNFPLGAPLAFNAEQLVIAMGPAPDATGHALLAEFSTALNLIPSGVVWPPSSQTGLDDVVREIVGQAEWAFADRSPEEEARYQADRVQIDLNNPEMALYASLKDAWVRAREALANDPGSPAAAEAERAANLALLANPARERIERAMQEFVALDERAPHRARERFEREISDGTGTFDNPSFGQFSPVRLLPRAVLTSAGWDSVTLDRAALDELATNAPAVLTNHLKLDESDDPIVQISFEYASALLHRSWFDPALFQMRCWRFSDSARVISDGKAPPSGECPAYVRAVVLVRNVAVTSTAPPQGGGNAGGDTGDISFILAKPEFHHREPIPGPVGPGPFEAPINPTDLMHVDVLPIEALQPSEPIVEGRHAMGDLGLEQPAEPTFAVAGFDAVALKPVHAPEAGVTPHLFGQLSAKKDIPESFFVEAALAPDIVLNQDFVTFHPVTPVEATEGTVTSSTPAGTVIVLALICKAVPLAPNPAPDAQWT